MPYFNVPIVETNRAIEFTVDQSQVTSVAELNWVVNALENRIWDEFDNGVWEDFEKYHDIGYKIGRFAARNGIQTDDQLISQWMSEYRSDQREYVSGTSHCEGGCRAANIICSGNGTKVCKLTMRQCVWMNDRIMTIAKLFDWQGVLNLRTKRIDRKLETSNDTRNEGST